MIFFNNRAGQQLQDAVFEAIIAAMPESPPFKAGAHNDPQAAAEMGLVPNSSAGAVFAAGKVFGNILRAKLKESAKHFRRMARDCAGDPQKTDALCQAAVLALLPTCLTQSNLILEQVIKSLQE